MVIERTTKELIIRLPANINIEELQRFVDFLSYKEVTSNTKAKQHEVDVLAKEVKKGWWAKNRERFV